MDFKVREIVFQDLFVVSKILKKINVKEIVKNQDIIDVAGKNTEQKQKISDKKGLEFLVDIMANAGDAEKEIIQFIANLSSVKVEDVQAWKMAELQEFCKKFMESNKLTDVISFFKNAISSMK